MTGGREWHATPWKVKFEEEKKVALAHDFLGGVSETLHPTDMSRCSQTPLRSTVAQSDLSQRKGPRRSFCHFWIDEIAS